jgi:hypothetical protein
MVIAPVFLLPGVDQVTSSQPEIGNKPGRLNFSADNQDLYAFCIEWLYKRFRRSFHPRRVWLEPLKCKRRIKRGDGPASMSGFYLESRISNPK